MRLFCVSTSYFLIFVVTGLLGTGCSRYKLEKVLFQIGGTVTGLNGTVVLTNNNSDDLAISADGAFAFPNFLRAGVAYDVAIKSQPAGQTCALTNGQGTAAGEENISNVVVTCGSSQIVTQYEVGGTVSGLTGGQLVLQNNGGDDQTVTSDGAYKFATKLDDGADYAVTIKTQPDDLVCSATNSNGKVSGYNVTNVNIQCATNGYTVGGTVTGLTGTLVLSNNGGNDLTVTTNSSFTFSDVVADGAAYAVTVKTQPAGQSCSLANSNGIIAGAAVTNVAVTCSTHTYTIGGSVTGLSGTVVLQNNNADDLTINSNGNFTFATAVNGASTYEVSVLSHPAGQYCLVTNDSGTASGNVTNVTVSCGPTKIITLTATKVRGALGGTPANATDAKDLADGLCDLGYLAMIGSSVRYPPSTDWVLDPNTHYVRPTGEYIGTTNANAVFDFPLKAAISMAEVLVWTGLSASWIADYTCNDWTTNLQMGTGRAGYSGSLDSGAIDSTLVACNQSYNLYCVEQ